MDIYKNLIGWIFGLSRTGICCQIFKYPCNICHRQKVKDKKIVTLAGGPKSFDDLKHTDIEINYFHQHLTDKEKVHQILHCETLNKTILKNISHPGELQDSFEESDSETEDTSVEEPKSDPTETEDKHIDT